MLRLSISELTTFRWTFEEDVRHYAKHGLDGIGVWRQKFAECGEERGVDLLCEYELDVSSLTWAGGFTGSDGRSFVSSVEDGIEALRLAAAIRADCLVVYTGGRGGHTRRHARRLAANALRELTAAADDLDMILAIEPMHPGCGLDWTFLSSLETALEIISEFPLLKLVFDTYYWAHSPEAMELLPSLVPHIALVQFGDAKGQPHGEQDRWPPGEGNLPLRTAARILIDEGYDGFFELELMGPEIETRDYEALVESSTRALAQLCGVKN